MMAAACRRFYGRATRISARARYDPLETSSAVEPETAYEILATDSGLARFWAEATEETDDAVVFRLLNEPGRIDGTILERVPGRSIAFQYFAESRARFVLEADGNGGTDLTLEAGNVDASFHYEMTAGWVSVLMSLKAAVGFGVDLRNHDADRIWDQGFVDG